MKKLIIIFLLFITLSFYITNLVVENIKNNDSLMEKIKSTSSKYKTNYKNAIIKSNTIKSGKYGKDIDYNKSYSSMKKYGAYNETMTTLKEVKPTISIEDNYDKYLIGTSSSKKEISLVFIGEDFPKTMNILNKENIKGTFFIDGTILNKNYYLLKNTNHEIEILSYNNTYDKSLFKSSILYLETITKKKANYCYTENDNDYLLKLCKKLKLHTIKPSIVIDKDLYHEVKNNLDNSIISIRINNYTNRELRTVIKYIKSKGYNIVKLEELLSEKIDNN